MDPIKRVYPVDRVTRPAETARPRLTVSGGPSTSPAADRVELSQEAQATLRLAGTEEPEDRSAEIRRRIQQGYYQRVDVVGSIVDALLRDIQQG